MTGESDGTFALQWPYEPADQPVPMDDGNMAKLATCVPSFLLAWLQPQVCASQHMVVLKNAHMPHDRSHSWPTPWSCGLGPSWTPALPFHHESSSAHALVELTATPAGRGLGSGKPLHLGFSFFFHFQELSFAAVLVKSLAPVSRCRSFAHGPSPLTQSASRIYRYIVSSKIVPAPASALLHASRTPHCHCWH